MKLKIYFYKHGFQTDGVSLWVVQQGRNKWYANEVVICRSIEGVFQNKNPHAYFQTVASEVEPMFMLPIKKRHFQKIVIL